VVYVVAAGLCLGVLADEVEVGEVLNDETHRVWSEALFASYLFQLQALNNQGNGC
jgi:hypothetical protein